MHSSYSLKDLPERSFCAQKPEDALAMIEAVLDYARSRDSELYIRALCLRSFCYRQVRQSDKAIGAAEEARRALYLRSDAEPGLSVLVCEEEAANLAAAGRIAGAREKFSEVLGLYRLTGDLQKELKALVNVAIMYAMSGELSDALRYLYAALDRIGGAETGDQATSYRKIEILANIGTIHTEFGDYAQALRYQEMAAEIGEALPDPLVHWNCRWTIAFTLLKQGDTLAAGQKYEEILAIAEATQDKRARAVALDGLGEIARINGDSEVARRNLEEARQIFAETGNVTDLAATCYNLARLYAGNGEYSRARKAAEESLGIVQASGLRRLEFQFFELLSVISEAEGDHSGALAAYKRFTELRDEVIGQLRQQEILNLRLQIEHEKNEKERQLMQARNARLEEMALSASRELESLAGSLVQKKELLGKVRSDVRRIAAAIGEKDSAAEDARMLLRRLDEALDGRRDWTGFERQFHKVNQDFIRKISVEWPGLTPVELKVCALLKVNCSTKDIAELLCISTNTVDRHRTHIRRKLGLKASANLTSFLSGI